MEAAGTLVPVMASPIPGSIPDPPGGGGGPGMVWLSLRFLYNRLAQNLLPDRTYQL